MSRAIYPVFLTLLLLHTATTTAQQLVTKAVQKQGYDAVVRSKQLKHLSDSLKTTFHYCVLPGLPQLPDSTNKPWLADTLNYDIEVYGPPIHCAPKCVYTFTYSVKTKKVVRAIKTWDDTIYPVSSE